MIIRPIITKLRVKSVFYGPNSILAHTVTCPTKHKPGGSSSGDSGISTNVILKRAEKSGPCRFGFIPEEWFLFFHSKTGVTGPYIFGLVVTNYLLSKEIYIMEHEYYCGLSIALIVYFVTTRLGPKIGEALDKQVKAELDELEAGRKQETDLHEAAIKMATDAQLSAKSQKLLMDAKKENIAMQLEAIYRDRAMVVYRTVKGRMDYHVKKYGIETRIQQRWMLSWILENVYKSITPDLQKKALEQAIQDLVAVADKGNS